jgi:hypothetical protein
MNDLRKTQASFARKAQAQPTHRFGDLYHLICREEWLSEALRCVLRNTGSALTALPSMMPMAARNSRCGSILGSH